MAPPNATPRPPALLGDVGALAELRALVRSTMTAVCDVLTRATVTGAGGARTETWAVAAAGVPCAFRPAASPAEGVAADAATVVTRYVVKLPVGTAVSAVDRVRITHGQAGLPDPLVLDVVGVAAKSTEVARSVLATLATAGGV